MYLGFKKDVSIESINLSKAFKISLTLIHFSSAETSFNHIVVKNGTQTVTVNKKINDNLLDFVVFNVATNKTKKKNAARME